MFFLQGLCPKFFKLVCSIMSMTSNLFQEHLIPMSHSFKKELFETLLALNLPEYSNNTGNKQFTTFQKLALVILYFRSQKSLRDFCDEINIESLWKRDLKLKYDLKKSTLNDWVKSFDLDFIKQVLDQTNKGDNPKILGIDGTGIASQFKSSYYQKRLKDFGLNPKSPYHKLDIIADLENYKKIYDFTFTMKQYSDKKQAKRLLKRYKFRNTILIGDKGYYYYYLFQKMKEDNNLLIVPPIKSSKNCVHRNFLREEFQNTYYENEEIYPLRNNVEGVFSVLKRTILTKIISKNFMTKKREVAFKIVIYNMKKNLFQTIYFVKNIVFFDGKKTLLANF